MRNFDDYDDYYDDYDDYVPLKKFKNGKNSKGKNKKGHKKRQKEAEIWLDLNESNPNMVYIPEESIPVQSAEVVDNIIPTVVAPEPTVVPTATTPNRASTTTFIPGPNTHTIKGNTIDFDRVANIEKIDNEHNGKKTFGIKFLFMGTKGLYRIAWFNQNMRERDAVYSTEITFWHNLGH